MGQTHSSINSKKKWFLIFLGVILVLLGGIVGFVNWTVRGFELYNAKKFRQTFEQFGLPMPIAADFFASAPEMWGQKGVGEAGLPSDRTYRMRYYLSEELELRPKKPILYLIHGAPGGAVNFFDKSYFLNRALRKEFVLLAMDRPGYGASGRGQAEPEFERAVQPLVEQLIHIKKEFPERKIYGLGWSYGGPLLAMIAFRVSQEAELLVQGQQIVDGVIMVATPADPLMEKFWWFNPLLEWSAINWMFTAGVRVANVEKMAHQEELRKMREYWGKIYIPTAYLQGTDDNIVIPQNLEYLRAQVGKKADKMTLAESQFYEIQGGGHNIVFTEIDLIERILTEWQNF